MGRAAVAAEMVVHLNAIAQKGKWPNGSRQIGKKKKKRSRREKFSCLPKRECQRTATWGRMWRR